MKCGKMIPSVLVLTLVSQAILHPLGAGDCLPGGEYPPVWTDQFAFIIESGSGAVGDVVGVTVFLRSSLDFSIERSIGMEIVVCHDVLVADIVGEPIYTEEFLSMLGHAGVRSRVQNFFGVFLLGAGLDAEAYKLFFPSDVPVPLFSIYYRLKGKPGDICNLRFCSYKHNGCRVNSLQPVGLGTNHYLSTMHQGGTLKVLEGPATHPDRPPEPPKAKVYPVKPTLEEANFRVRITDAVARPGELEVPVEVYVSADVEYTTVQIPIDFDERYLRLSRAEDYFITGGVRIDNRNETAGANPQEGHAIVISGLGVSNRRIAAEGEEFHAATLYFDILPSAAAVLSTTISVRPVVDQRGVLYEPILIVRCGSGEPGPLKAEQVERAEIPPVATFDGRVLFAPEALVLRGDGNFDDRIDLADAVCILSFLFAGGPEPLCTCASDFNRDGRLDIADPIAELSAIFLGDPPLDDLQPARVPCR